MSLLFSGVPPDRRRLARRYLTEVSVGAAESLTTRGSSDPALGWVDRGLVSLELARETMFQIGDGGVVGSEDVFGGFRRSFSAVAMQPTTLWLMRSAHIEQLERRAPAVAARFELGALRTLAELIRTLDLRVVENARQFIREHIGGSRTDFPLLREVLGPEAVSPESSFFDASRDVSAPFGALSQAIADELMANALLMDLDPGQVLVREGATSEHVYVIVEGRLQALAALDDHTSIRLGVSEPGATVGVTSALLGQHHLATCIALSRVKAVRIPAPVWQGALSLQLPEAGPFRRQVAGTMATWVPPVRDQAECAHRCLRGVIRQNLLSDESPR